MKYLFVDMFSCNYHASDFFFSNRKNLKPSLTSKVKKAYICNSLKKYIRGWKFIWTII